MRGPSLLSSPSEAIYDGEQDTLCPVSAVWCLLIEPALAGLSPGQVIGAGSTEAG
jgi:hypothetical protein